MTNPSHIFAAQQICSNSVSAFAYVCIRTTMHAVNAGSPERAAEVAFDVITRCQGNRPEGGEIRLEDRKLVIAAIARKMLELVGEAP